MILAAAAELRSRFTPMPVGLHLGFCAFATVIFLLVFIRKKSVSSLIWAMICDATVILELYHDPRTATAVGVAEIVMFAILIWLWFGERRDKKRKAAEAAAAEKGGDGGDGGEPEQPADDLNDIAKLVKNERSKIASDDRPNDIIGNAFEDDKL